MLTVSRRPSRWGTIGKSVLQGFKGCNWSGWWLLIMHQWPPLVNRAPTKGEAVELHTKPLMWDLAHFAIRSVGWQHVLWTTAHASLFSPELTSNRGHNEHCSVTMIVHSKKRKKHENIFGKRFTTQEVCDWSEQLCDYWYLLCSFIHFSPWKNLKKKSPKQVKSSGL